MDWNEFNNVNRVQAYKRFQNIYTPSAADNFLQPFQPGPIDGVNLQSMILEHQGGKFQQNRMIKNKRKTLSRAVLYSYQGAFVSNLRWYDLETNKLLRPPARALINPNKLKPDYDDKVISIGFEEDFKVGDILKWEDTDTYWIIYLQDLTELAYFRGDIRKCSYNIQWRDENGEVYSTYAAIRGPVETKINYIQKQGISVDVPNHSLNLMIPANEHTLKYFQRYAKFYLKQDTSVCWRVEAWDSISVPGILELNAVEYYGNKDTDDKENGIVNGLIVPLEEENTQSQDELILGKNLIQPKITETYRCRDVMGGQWSVQWLNKNVFPNTKSMGVPIQWIQTQPNEIKVKWQALFSGSFKITLKLKKTGKYEEKEVKASSSSLIEGKSLK